MKIGILSRWNATCGVALHAELIGRELLKRGHPVRVFAPELENASRWWHHKIIGLDEDFVKRVYTELSPEGEEGHLNVGSVLQEDMDLIIVESYEKLPYRDVEELILSLKERDVPSVAIIHEGSREDIGYDLSIFDKIVVFDERYVKEVLPEGIPEDKILIVPYPCYPPVERRRRFAEDGRIVFFSFGRQPKEEYNEFLEALRVLKKKFPSVVYRIIRSGEPLDVREEWIEQERRVLNFKEIYRYLGEADFHLLPKGRTGRVVVSSTFCQTVGSLCITVSPDTRFFEEVPRGDSSPLILYRDTEDLISKLTRAIVDEVYREKIRENVRVFAEERNVKRVVDIFEELIYSVFVKYSEKIV